MEQRFLHNAYENTWLRNIYRLNSNVQDSYASRCYRLSTLPYISVAYLYLAINRYHYYVLVQMEGISCLKNWDFFFLHYLLLCILLCYIYIYTGTYILTYSYVYEVIISSNDIFFFCSHIFTGFLLVMCYIFFIRGSHLKVRLLALKIGLNPDLILLFVHWPQIAK